MSENKLRCQFEGMGKRQMLKAMTKEKYEKCQKCFFWSNCSHFEKIVFDKWLRSNQ